MTALLVDGHSLAHRAWHVGGELHDAKQRPTGMAYFFLTMLRSALVQSKATECWVAWDHGTWRCEVYPEYKAKRRATADGSLTTDGAFMLQRLWLLDVLPQLNVGVVAACGYEGDDVLALLSSLTRWDDVWIHSGDRDFWQLVSARVRCVMPPVKTRKTNVVTLENFAAVTSCETPNTWLAFRVLSGDASDNITGLPKVGPVRAKKLLAEHGTLAAVRVASPVDAQAIIDRNVLLMDLTAAAARLRREWKHVKRVRPPAWAPDPARAAIRDRSMARIVGYWDDWVAPFQPR
jgi:DNA polymerase-1